MVDEYIASLQKDNSDAESRKLIALRGRLKEGLEYFSSKGISVPTEEDYDAWREVLKATKSGRAKGTPISDKTTKDFVYAFKNFISWRDSRQMTIEVPEVSEAQETQVRRGRKEKPEAERRSVKMSIYLTQRIYDGLKTLAAATQQDISDVIFSLAEDFVTRNEDKIEATKNFFETLGTIK